MGILCVYVGSYLLYTARTRLVARYPHLGRLLTMESLVNSPQASIFAYCASSILMTVTNKYVLSGYDFNLNCLLLAVQQLVGLCTIALLKQFGVISYRNFNKDEAKKWFPIALMLVIMVYTSSKAIHHLSIPVYTIFKNLTIILIAYGEVLWFGGKVSTMALGSFFLMVLSSVLACYGDSAAVKATGSWFEIYIGYFWMATNCFASAAFVLCMRKRIKLTNFKDFDTTFYNNLLTTPILLVLSLVFEDWSAANVTRNFPPASRLALIIAMVLSGFSGVAISYCSAWCVRVTSSTTYSMVGALNKLPIALSGLVFFDAAVNFWSVNSIFVGFLSGLVYAIAQQKQKAAVAAAPVLPTSK